LARAFVADLKRRTCHIQFTGEHALPRGIQAKLNDFPNFVAVPVIRQLAEILNAYRVSMGTRKPV
jgi:hypothetical protein